MQHFDTGASVSRTDVDLPSTHHSISITGMGGGSSVVARRSKATLLEIDDILLPVHIWVCLNSEGTILGIDPLLGELGAVVDAFHRRLLWTSCKSHKSALEGRWVPTRSVAALVPCVPITWDWTGDGAFGTVCQLVPEVWATRLRPCPFTSRADTRPCTPPAPTVPDQT
ncbi:hypothetical protein chiPu_0023991 [Chiloscyllium punctatum]|uniref:Uncharacterized protein n=1 Tax=Chiloscyllium punctatum TaxID=137246 RepID=A0A401TCH4_CHIPU|nr:hypothetical protein [Chiloscyllium punctatum]